MFRFANTDYLYILYLIPVIIGLFWFTYRLQNKSLQEFANNALHKVLFPFRSGLKIILKFGIKILALILIIFALANPQIGSKIEEVKTSWY